MNIKAGDIFRVKRSMQYWHWGVYIGNDEVIHFTDGTSDSNLKTKNKAKIMQTKLSVFMNGASEGQVVKFPRRYTDSRDYEKFGLSTSILGTVFSKAIERDKEYRLYSNKDVVERAKQKLDCGNYNLFNNNCEHFASWCKTGVAISFQSDWLDRFARKIIARDKTKEEVFNTTQTAMMVFPSLSTLTKIFK